MTNQLLVTLDGITVDEAGASTEEFIEELGFEEVLEGVLSILSVVVRQLGGHEAEDQQSDDWIRRPKGLQLRPNGPGYLFAQWTLEPSPDLQTNSESYGTRAIDTLLEYGERGESACTESVMGYLSDISDALPKGVFLWLGDAENSNKVEIKRREDTGHGIGLHRDEALVSDLHAIGLRSAALLGPGPSSVEHGDLLYDERGLPK